MNTNNTIKQLQNKIKSKDYYPMFKRDYLVRLEGEMGALVNAIYPEKSHHESDPAADEIGDALSHIIHSVLAIANLYDIDVEKLVSENDEYSE